MKLRPLAALTLVASLGATAGVSDVLATSASAGGPPARAFALSGTIVGVNAPVHQFTVLSGVTRYTIMTTTQSRFTLNTARTSFNALTLGQQATVRGLFRARFRVAATVALRRVTTTTISTVPASTALTTALNNALTQERYALATYKNVVAKLGAYAPFTNIINSETQHVATVTALMTAHGVSVPVSTTTGAAAPATRVAACQLGVTTETTIIAMYQNGITLAKDFPDVVRAFSNLLDASQYGHLPAFLRCS
jgi:hypothetical protein